MQARGRLQRQPLCHLTRKNGFYLLPASVQVMCGTVDLYWDILYIAVCILFRGVITTPDVSGAFFLGLLNDSTAVFLHQKNKRRLPYMVAVICCLVITDKRLHLT